MTLYVGTSGWAYREWKPGFYPPQVPQSKFLAHYAQELAACEINATFYRLQSSATFDRWIAQTPPSFRFAVKAHRRLTHARTIGTDGAWKGFLGTFLDTLSVLGPRLGPVLFQFPPHRARDHLALDNLLALLPPGFSYAFEFRHPSWSSQDVAQQLAQAGATLCISDCDGSVPDALPPGPIAYVRLRAESYAPQQRARWQELLEREAAVRDVYAFTKHEGVPAGDPLAGVGLAQWMVAHA